MTGVRQGGVKGCSDRTGCQTMNAAKNGSPKKKKLLFLTAILTGYVACMALVDFRRSLVTFL